MTVDREELRKALDSDHDPYATCMDCEDVRRAAARERLAQLDTEAVEAKDAEVYELLADIVRKATQYGRQEGGFIANYIIPTGPIHRAIPYLQSRGIATVDEEPL